MRRYGCGADRAPVAVFSRRAARIAAFGCAGVLLFVACSAVRGGAAVTSTRGQVLYERHCAGCHGIDGGAETSVRDVLLPRPRSFRDGVFQLASTANGVPTEADLVQSLRRGMPGSAMPAYDWLADGDLVALAQHVRELALAGLVAQIDADARERGLVLAAAELRARAEQRLRPGAAVGVPPPLPATPANHARGQQLFVQHCSLCHGGDGKGRPTTPDWIGAADAFFARDFTAGLLRGEASRPALAARIRAGMPASSMPPTLLDDTDTALLIAYVQALVPDGVDRRAMQWRRRLRAVRLPQVPAAADDPAWDRVEAVRLPLAPLWWRAEAVDEVSVRAAHDGTQVVFLLQWADATRDDRATAGRAQGDGAAVQVTTAGEPPALPMGGTDAVEIWHWKAFRPADVAGGLDLAEERGSSDATAAASGLRSPQRRGEAIAVHGPAGMQQDRGSGRAIRALPLHQDGHWRLQIGRELRPQRAAELPLTAGAELLVAFAVWDAAVDHEPWSKSVSTWHAVALDR